MPKILIVDDEEDTRTLAKALLEGIGYEIEEAKNGPDGLKKIKKNKFDLVILDFFMPSSSINIFLTRKKKAIIVMAKKKTG